MGCKFMLLLATRCLYLGRHQGGIGGQGYIWPNISLTHRLTKCHAELQWYHSWPLDACIGGKGGVRLGYQGGQCMHRGCQGASGVDIWTIKMVYCKVLLKTQDSLLNIADNRTWAQVNWTQVSTTLGQQMPLPGDIEGHRGWWGGGTSPKHQPDLQADDVMLTCSSTTLDHYMPVLGMGWGIKGPTVGEGIGGYIWQMKMVYCKVLLKTQDSLLQTIEHEFWSTGSKLVRGWGYVWQNINMTPRLMT